MWMYRIYEQFRRWKGTNAVRYFRPIRYTESCLACHGDPSRSQELWGRDDGRDVLGYKMEGVDEGDLKGAFEIIRPLDKAQAQLSTNLWTAGIGAALVVGLIVLGMLWFVQRRISRPLNDTINRMQCISESGDLTARVPEARVPEMGRLSRSFNEFVTGLAETFKDYRNQTSQLASSSEELSATAEEISQNAQSSSQRVEQVSSSAQEVNEVVQDVANNIQTVSDAAGKSSQSTQEGKEAVDQAAQRLDKLKASSGRVDEIIATIQNIAKKTDLLALNAAIEAANAGEQGKGFAVVADEVRKLAEQTSQATTQVNDIISEVRQHSDSSVEAMNQVQSKMDEVLSNIENTDQTANQIAAAAEELAATEESEWLRTSLTTSLTWPVASDVCSASLRTSSATTAKPLPCSPALAASMAAFSASRSVFLAMAWMVSMISSTRSPEALSLLMRSEACSTAFIPSLVVSVDLEADSDTSEMLLATSWTT